MNLIQVSESEVKQFFDIMSEFNKLPNEYLELLPKTESDRVTYIKNILLCCVKVLDVEALTLNLEHLIDEFIEVFALRVELKEALHDADGEFFKRTMAQESLQELKEKIIRDLGDPRDINHIKLD